MQWKLVSAFATGAVLASGIVYFAVKPVDVRKEDSPKPVVMPAPAKAVAPVPSSVVAAAPVAAPERVPANPAPGPVHHAVVREKPSPMPPPLRRPKEVAIARTAPPSLPPAEPAPAAPPVEPTPTAPTPTPTVAAPVAPSPASPAPQEKVPLQNVSATMPSVEPRVPNTVTLTAGTMLSVRIGESLSSARNQPGDSFLATLTGPLVIDGWVIAERGARVEGRVVDTTQAGRVKGVSHLSISLVRLATSDGQNVRIRTEPYVKDGPTSTGTDAAKIGAGAAIGAIIGAIAGGGKGAGIGAGAGGAAGAGDVLLTRGKPAEIPVETRVSFRVQDSVTITERLN